MSKRVSDEVCTDIQVKMLQLEAQIDKMRRDVASASRADSALMAALHHLHRACVAVHRAAGLEQER